MVALATAHPAKFPDAVEQSIGLRPELPEQCRAITVALGARVVGRRVVMMSLLTVR